jgi:hypothetical protein
MVTFIFTLVGFRYLSDLVRAAAAVGTFLQSPGDIIVARVGFAGFPLSFAILAFASPISKRWLLRVLYMPLTVVRVLITVRVFGILLDHSKSESARLLVTESIPKILSNIAIRLGSASRRLEAKGSA